MTVATHARKQRFKIALDGEIFHIQAPLSFEALPDALQLLVPNPREAAVRR